MIDPPEYCRAVEGVPCPDCGADEENGICKARKLWPPPDNLIKIIVVDKFIDAHPDE